MFNSGMKSMDDVKMLCAMHVPFAIIWSVMKARKLE